MILHCDVILLLDVFINICSANVEVETAPCEGPAETKIQWETLNNPIFQQARKSLARLVSIEDQVAPRAVSSGSSAATGWEEC